MTRQRLLILSALIALVVSGVVIAQVAPAPPQFTPDNNVAQANSNPLPPVGGPRATGSKVPLSFGSLSPSHSVTDLVVHDSLGDVPFTRYYTPSLASWNFYDNNGWPGGQPFGLAPNSNSFTVAMTWTHSFYSYVVHQHAYQASDQEIFEVRLPGGEAAVFPLPHWCLGCFVSGRTADGSRLYVESNAETYIFYKPGVGRYYFRDCIDHPANPPADPVIRRACFLTKVEDETYPDGDAGTQPHILYRLHYDGGSPYVDNISTHDDLGATAAQDTASITFTYGSVPTGRGVGSAAQESVLTQVTNAKTGKYVQFTYWPYVGPDGGVTSINGGPAAGDIASASNSWDHSRNETYAYGSELAPRFDVTRSDGTRSAYNLQDATSGIITNGAETPGGLLPTQNYSAGANGAPPGCRNTEVCGTDSCFTPIDQWYQTDAPLGDGVNDSVSLKEHGLMACGDEVLGTIRQNKYVECVGAGCGAWPDESHFQELWTTTTLTQSDGGSITLNKGHRDQSWNWTADDWSFAPTDDAGFPFDPPLELSKVTSGLPGDVSEDGPLFSSTSYGYKYNQSAHTRPDDALTEPAAFEQHTTYTKSNTGATAGRGVLETFRTFDATHTNRLVSVIHKGNTTLLDGGSPSKYVGTFFFTSDSCTHASDPLGRVVEVHGPCFVADETASDCSPSLNSASVPVTRYTYDTGGTPLCQCE